MRDPNSHTEVGRSKVLMAVSEKAKSYFPQKLFFVDSDASAHIPIDRKLLQGLRIIALRGINLGDGRTENNSRISSACLTAVVGNK